MKCQVPEFLLFTDYKREVIYRTLRILPSRLIIIILWLNRRNKITTFVSHYDRYAIRVQLLMREYYENSSSESRLLL